MILTLAGAQIDMFAVTVAREAGVLRRDWALLDADERRRADLLRSPARRGLFVAAHARLRREVGARLDCSPAEVPLARMPCSRCGSSAHGRPVVAGGSWASVSSSKPHVARPVKDTPWFSVSYAEDLAVIALSSRPVGVDVEHTFDEQTAQRLREMLLNGALPQHLGHEFIGALQSSAVSIESAAEAGSSEDAAHKLTRAWVRAEARLKALGCGLCDRPRPAVDGLVDERTVPAAASVPDRALVIADAPVPHDVLILHNAAVLLPDASALQKAETSNRQPVAHVALAV
ncbi:hypothetical protein F8O07_04255 [Pseudoclavibacter sp. CFCC 13796]|uniref:4'-phosphopantetheinyl transferase family protein n=1 Tax=Pseudoclavibacter sp. CFCC 13796 TaxID=2615179 RepID=UPI0013013BF1|nr:4'-phosphopantetheinyl transferase superfamily protein [Pseudoclavibacter sp. CFCC 13796]KAB1661168.1 hypothetical protein F8O07_04255 [Pseudoclavibacter sp. CFCC 13796]